MFTTARLVFQPVSADLAAAVVAGDLSGVTPADGWPHEDTRDGLGGVALGAFAWLVMLDGTVIGDCGTHGVPDESGNIEIGYGLAAPFRGHGYGTETVAGLSEHLLRRPDVRRVIAETLVGNTPSRRALAGAGFVLVEENAENALYELIPTD